MSEKILNVHKFHSTKKDKDYCILLILRDLTESEKKQGFLGELTTEEVFLPDELIDKFNADSVGKEVKRMYSIVGGRAYLESIDVVK